MPSIGFRGDPYRALDVPHDASAGQIKRRYRELARELHPDRVPDGVERQRRTREMARINAAYDLLRDEERRGRYDALHGLDRSRRWRAAGEGTGRSGRFEPPQPAARPGGPPPPPRSRPVTARFDTSDLYHRRNATTTEPPPRYAAQRPASTRQRLRDGEPLRASHPSGPVERRRGRKADLPTLAEARATMLEFGRFRGHTLGQVEDAEPTYIDWIAKTITRDRDLVVRARVIQADLDERGVRRSIRPPRPGFGLRGIDIETGEPAAP
jgi:curved DNA-binding protein CbpA